MMMAGCGVDATAEGVADVGSTVSALNLGPSVPGTTPPGQSPPPLRPYEWARWCRDQAFVFTPNTAQERTTWVDVTQTSHTRYLSRFHGIGCVVANTDSARVISWRIDYPVFTADACAAATTARNIFDPVTGAVFASRTSHPSFTKGLCSEFGWFQWNMRSAAMLFTTSESQARLELAVEADAIGGL